MPDYEDANILGLKNTSVTFKNVKLFDDIVSNVRKKEFKSAELMDYEKLLLPHLKLWKKLVQETTVLKTYELLKDDKILEEPWNNFKYLEMNLAYKLFTVSTYYFRLLIN